MASSWARPFLGLQRNRKLGKRAATDARSTTDADFSPRNQKLHPHACLCLFVLMIPLALGDTETGTSETVETSRAHKMGRRPGWGVLSIAIAVMFGLICCLCTGLSGSLCTAAITERKQMDVTGFLSILVPIDFVRKISDGQQPVDAEFLKTALIHETVISTLIVPFACVVGFIFTSCTDGTPAMVVVTTCSVFVARSKAMEYCFLQCLGGGVNLCQDSKDIMLSALETADKILDSFSLAVLFFCDDQVHPRLIQTFSSSSYACMRACVPLLNYVHMWHVAALVLLNSTLLQGAVGLVFCQGTDPQEYTSGSLVKDETRRPSHTCNFIVVADLCGLGALAARVSDTNAQNGAKAVTTPLRVFLESALQGMLQVIFVDLIGGDLSAQVTLVCSITMSALVTIKKGLDLLVPLIILIKEDGKDFDSGKVLGSIILLFFIFCIIATGVFMLVKLWMHEQCTNAGHDGWGLSSCEDFTPQGSIL